MERFPEVEAGNRAELSSKPAGTFKYLHIERGRIDLSNNRPGALNLCYLPEELPVSKHVLWRLG